MYLVRRAFRFRALLLGRIVVLVLLGSPSGTCLGIRLLLLLAVILEVAVAEAYPRNVLLSAGSLVVIAMASVLGALQRETPPGFVHDTVVFCLTAAIVGAIACALTFFRERMAWYGRETEN